MGFRLTAITAAVLFGGCAVVQYNDPDPVIWILAYATAGAVGLAAAAGRGHWLLSGALAAVYLLWAATLLPGVVTSSDFTGEQARETGGLLLCFVWALFLTLRERRSG